MLDSHVDAVTSDGIRPHALSIEDLNGLVVCINSDKSL